VVNLPVSLNIPRLTTNGAASNHIIEEVTDFGVCDVAIFPAEKIEENFDVFGKC